MEIRGRKRNAERKQKNSFSCHVSNVVLSSSLAAIRNKISLSNFKDVKEKAF